MAVASLVLGIVTLVCIFLGPLGWIGVILGIVGIILGILAKKTAPSGMATAGLVCSIIGTAICGLSFLACVACAGCVSSSTAGLGALGSL